MNDLNDIVSSILFSIYNDKSYTVNVKSITGQGNINGSGNTGLHLLSFLKHAFEVIMSINKNIKMASGDKAISVKSKLISTFGNTYSINSNNMNELRPFHHGFINAEGYQNLARMLGIHYYQYISPMGMQNAEGTIVNVDALMSLINQAIKKINNGPICLHNVQDTTKNVYKIDPM